MPLFLRIVWAKYISILWPEFLSVVHGMVCTIDSLDCLVKIKMANPLQLDKPLVLSRIWVTLDPTEPRSEGRRKGAESTERIWVECIQTNNMESDSDKRLD